MKKSHIWTIAMAFASLMNTPMSIEDDDLESLMSETKTIETESRVDLLAYFPETESETYRPFRNSLGGRINTPSTFFPK